MGEFEPPDEQDLEIRIPPEWEAGLYANTSSVSFTTREFTVDFVRVVPDGSIGVLVARIACSSEAAIDLFLNLQSQLRLWSDRLLSDPGGNGNGEAR
jgi:Protein of unknown function (DUF3467)